MNGTPTRGEPDQLNLTPLAPAADSAASRSLTDAMPKTLQVDEFDGDERAAAGTRSAVASAVRAAALIVDRDLREDRSS